MAEVVKPGFEFGSCTGGCPRDPSTPLRFAQDDLP
jgi:hypothetical protein